MKPANRLQLDSLFLLQHSNNIEKKLDILFEPLRDELIDGDKNNQEIATLTVCMVSDTREANDTAAIRRG